MTIEPHQLTLDGARDGLTFEPDRDLGRWGWMEQAQERFWPKFDFDGPNGCWIWTGAQTKGYGVLQLGQYRGTILTHRMSYMLLRGRIPPGLVIDHLCRNRPCGNPWHFELVTPEENSRRGHPFLVRQTHCKYGHEFTPANLKPNKAGQQMCRACHVRKMRDLRARKSGRAISLDPRRR